MAWVQAPLPPLFATGIHALRSLAIPGGSPAPPPRPSWPARWSGCMARVPLRSGRVASDRPSWPSLAALGFVPRFPPGAPGHPTPAPPPTTQASGELKRFRSTRSASARFKGRCASCDQGAHCRPLEPASLSLCSVRAFAPRRSNGAPKEKKVSELDGTRKRALQSILCDSFFGAPKEIGAPKETWGPQVLYDGAPKYLRCSPGGAPK